MRTWVRTLIISACVCLVLAVGGAWLHKFGIAPFSISINLVLVGFGLSVIVAVLAIGTLFVGILRRQPFGLFTMFGAFLICFCIAGYAAILFNKSASTPVTHNISTDLVDPPMFSQVTLDRRGTGSNPVALDDHKKALHKGAFDDVKTHTFNTTHSHAFAIALELVRDRGWEILVTDPQAGVIEATAETFWFGFKDDVAIRVRENPEAGNVSVDLHSVSRIGQSDLGANAGRIRSFLKDLTELLGASQAAP